jgi:hypothetical protein
MKECGNGVTRGKAITNPDGERQEEGSLSVKGLNTQNGIFNELK